MRDLPGVGKITAGSIRFEGRDMATLSGAELRAIRGSKIAMVYQEPMASLNPTMLIGRQLMEVPLIHEKVSKKKPAPGRSTWSRRCACPTRSGSCAPIRISSPAGSNSGS